MTVLLDENVRRIRHYGLVYLEYKAREKLILSEMSLCNSLGLTVNIKPNTDHVRHALNLASFSSATLFPDSILRRLHMVLEHDYGTKRQLDDVSMIY